MSPLLFRSGLLTLLFAFASSHAEEPRAIYERALESSKRFSDKVDRDRLETDWSSNSDWLWYRVNTAPGQHRFSLVNTRNGNKQEAFDHQALAKALGRNLKTSINADKLPFRRIQFDDDASLLTFQHKGRTWEWIQSKSLLKEAPSNSKNARSASERAPSRSQGKGGETWLTFVNKSTESLKLIWVTTDGGQRSYGTLKPGASTEQHTYAGHVWRFKTTSGKDMGWWEATAKGGEIVIDGSNPKAAPRKRRTSSNTSPDGKWQTSFRDHQLWLKDLKKDQSFALSNDGSESNSYSGRVYWSPDSSHVFMFQTEPAEEHKIHFVESAPKDQLQPKLHTLNYLKPGDRIAHSHPRLFSIDDRKPVPIDESLLPNPWRLNNVAWASDGKSLSFLYNQRGHQVLRLLKLSTDGTIETLINETSETFVDYSQKTYLKHLDTSNEILWMSERDGWNHLYILAEGTPGKPVQLTKGNWVVRKVFRVDEDARQIWFMAGGVYPDQDPYYQHLCRINLDGTGFKIMTEGDGTHEVTFSPDKTTFIDRWSRVDLPPVTELRSCVTGKKITQLEEANANRLLKLGWSAPERFVAKGRDGKTDIFGIILKPTNFDPKKSYPVIEYIYAGPHGAFVPKSWSTHARAMQMVEAGFIMVRIDGMGTNWRSRQFHDMAWKNIKDAGFPDRIKWIKAAAKTRPWMDLSRVGIYGGSAGGQNTLSALLHHGDFYHAGVADCGCHDNRMDKIWWNEAWMGWPIDESYADSSNVTHAHKLQGKLMLIVGELDRNVDPASTMQVVDALVKADKDFDLLVMPGTGHGAAERPYSNRRRMEFFIRNLLMR